MFVENHNNDSNSNNNKINSSIITQYLEKLDYFLLRKLYCDIKS